MKMIWVVSLIGVVFAAGASAREWTNQSGLKIEAEYVSCDGTTVVLDRGGKKIEYALAKLSAADREFIKQQMATPPAAAAATGWMHDFPVTPAFSEQKQYLSGRNARAVYQAFDKGQFPSEWSTNKKDAKAEFTYDVKSAKARVYVPAAYDGSKPLGVYLHVSPGDDGENLEEYAAVMDRHSLIYISPCGTSNDQPMLRRVKLAVDALASVRAKYKVDSKRVCVGGYSGGGHMSMLIHAMYPDLFMASVSHAAQSYLPGPGTCGHFPGLDAAALKSGPLREQKWCVISGDKDQNYKEILETSKQWEKGRYQYRFIDVPGMGHSNAPPEKFEEALKWIGL